MAALHFFNRVFCVYTGEPFQARAVLLKCICPRWTLVTNKAAFGSTLSADVLPVYITSTSIFLLSRLVPFYLQTLQSDKLLKKYFLHWLVRCVCYENIPIHLIIMLDSIMLGDIGFEKKKNINGVG